MSIFEKTKALRAEAWDAVVASDAHRAWKGLDDAVRAMTGENTQTVVRPVRAAPAAKRVTQGDVAFSVLVRNKEPLPIGRWLEKCINAGIGIGGDDPLPNFRSTASRDKRFYSFVRNNMYFWWLTGVELPESWKEATDPNLPGLSVASDSNDQEGGDGHAANNT